MTARGRLIAFMSGLAVIAFALAILVLARSQGGQEPPQAESRGLASVVLLATPGLIGWIGAWTRRPTVVVAAGVICLLQSVVAFSGVTLVYLLPAIGFLRAATDQRRILIAPASRSPDSSARSSRFRSRWRSSCRRESSGCSCWRPSRVWPRADPETAHGPASRPAARHGASRSSSSWWAPGWPRSRPPRRRAGLVGPNRTAP